MIAVAAIYLLGAAKDGFQPEYFKFLFYDLTFTHNWFIPKVPEVIQSMPLDGTGSHFWSISVEEQFYLFAPLLIVLAPFGRTVGLWLAVAAIAYLSGSWYASISLGVLAAVIRQKWGSWHGSKAWFAGFGAAALAATLVMVIVPDNYRWASPWAAIGIVLLTSAEGPRSRLGEFAGGMSYPFYLHHWMGMFAANAIAKRVDLSPLVLGWTAYFIAVCVGAAAYVVVDRTIMKYRGRYYTRMRGQAFAATAYRLLLTGVIGGAIYGLGA